MTPGTTFPSQPDPDRILAGYRALLEPPAVTDVLLREVLQIYPELLSELAAELGRALAFTQPAEEGRENVLRIVALLEECRELGVEEALRARRRLAGTQAAERRLQEEASRQARDRRPRGRTAPAQPAPWASGDLFPSLADCRAWFEQNLGQGTSRVTAKPLETDDSTPFEAILPRYLYRGESGAFAKTTSSLDRIIADPSIPAHALEDIVRTAITLRHDLEAAWELPPLLAEGFLQHYGMPTQDFDVSESIEVACSFASDLGVGDVGALCAIQMDLLAQNMRVVDLRHHPKADRPRRQRAFTITDPERLHRDLKQPDTIAACGMHWTQFVMTEPDLEAFRPDPWLLDAHSDPVAGLIELLIDSYEQIDDGAALWIAGRLQPAPFVFMTVPDPSDPERVAVEWLSADDAGIPYEPTDSRTRNGKYWSKRFPRPTPQELPAELLMDPEAIAASPGKVLTAVSRRGLEALGVLKRPPEQP